MEPKDNPNRLVAGTFQCQAQLTNARSLLITGHLYDDDTAEEISKRVDTAQAEIDRQLLRCDIFNKEQTRKAMKGGIEQIKEQLEALKARQDGKAPVLEGQPRPIKLSSQEKLALQNGDQQIKKMLENIQRLDQEISEGKQKLGMAA